MNDYKKLIWVPEAVMPGVSELMVHSSPLKVSTMLQVSVLTDSPSGTTVDTGKTA